MIDTIPNSIDIIPINVYDISSNINDILNNNHDNMSILLSWILLRTSQSKILLQYLTQLMMFPYKKMLLKLQVQLIVDPNVMLVLIRMVLQKKELLKRTSHQVIHIIDVRDNTLTQSRKTLDMTILLWHKQRKGRIGPSLRKRYN